MCSLIRIVVLANTEDGRVNNVPTFTTSTFTKTNSPPLSPPVCVCVYLSSDHPIQLSTILAKC